MVRALDADLDVFGGEVFSRLLYKGQPVWGGRYLRGLLIDGKRKSVEPMAARLGLPRQNLHHFVAISTWDYREVMRQVAGRAVRLLAPDAFVIDDHPFVRYGRGCAGSIVQHCGDLGQHRCQVAVSVHAVGRRGSAPLHWRLFLPQSWAGDPVRRAAAGVPADAGHRTKPEIALDLLDELAGWGQTTPLVMADSHYGDNAGFRAGLAARGIRWLLAVSGRLSVLPATGAPVTAFARLNGHTSVDELAAAHRYQGRCFTFRARTAHHRARSGWFVAARVHLAGIPERQLQARTDDRLLPEVTLLAQWRHKHGGDVFRTWITDLPPDTGLNMLVRHATSRWRIECDYREMEQALGLGDYEGRGYNGFHHHLTLVSAAHLFCTEQRLNPKARDTT